MNLTRPRPAGFISGGSRSVVAGWLLGAVLFTGTAAGCAPAPELDRDAARQLQAQVLAVTEAAANNDPAASLQQLDGLVLKLDEAAARGAVSFRRHQSIRSSVESVRADLTAQQAEAERAAAERAAAEREAAAQAAAQAQAESDAAAGSAAAAQAQANAAAAAAPPAVVAPAPVPPAEKGKPKGKGKANG